MVWTCIFPSIFPSGLMSGHPDTEGPRAEGLQMEFVPMFHACFAPSTVQPVILYQCRANAVPDQPNQTRRKLPHCCRAPGRRVHPVADPTPPSTARPLQLPPLHFGEGQTEACFPNHGKFFSCLPALPPREGSVSQPDSHILLPELQNERDISADLVKQVI